MNIIYNNKFHFCRPIFKEKSSHSVYDLVLHKDFAFDNGQMILHMAKIDGESNCIEFNIASLLRVEPDGFVITLLQTSFIMAVILFYCLN